MHYKKTIYFPPLRGRWSKAAGAGQDANIPNINALVDALENDRFRFDGEAWLGPDSIVRAREFLLRAWDYAGTDIPHSPAFSNLSAEDGIFPHVDRFLVLSALRKINPDPKNVITLNVLPSNLAAQDFWEDLENLEHGHDPSNVVFEVLEYGKPPYPVANDLLRKAQEKGYRYALDDFYPDEDNWKRLQDYAPYLDYIKLDGKLVREGFSGNSMLDGVLKHLKDHYPDLEIVAEFVENTQEACLLFEKGVSVVQGRNLPEGHLDIYCPLDRRGAIAPTPS